MTESAAGVPATVPAGASEDLVAVSMTVNGVPVALEVDSRTSLADILRRQLRLTGTHLGCEQGSCGACTVIIEGDRAVRSCLVLAGQADGMEIETVESLAVGGELNELQSAFREHHALQCGYCTSGFLMSVTARRREGPIITDEDAREAVSGNICRCTGYVGIVEAVLSLARPAETEHDSLTGTAR